MADTRFKDEKALAGEGGRSVVSRNVETRALLLVSVGLLLGLWLLYQVKSQRPVNFADLAENSSGAGLTLKVKDGIDKLLNLNRVQSPEEIVPYLTDFEEGIERDFIARKTVAERAERKGFQSVGALGSIRVKNDDSKDWQGLDDFRKRLDAAAERRAKRESERGLDPVGRLRDLLRDLLGMERQPVSVPLVEQVAPIRSTFIVRTPEEFRRALLISTAILLLSFWGLHVYRRARRFGGDQIILPNIFALCSLGFLMMVSLRDPLRDAMSFAGFAGGVFVGSTAVAVLSSFDYYGLYRALRSRGERADYYVTALPIALAILLSLLLIIAGKELAGSDAKINLGYGGFQFQPSEVIKLLLVFFIAGYFSSKWELVQNLDAKVSFFPRVKDVWVVFVCVAAVLSFFYLQKDLGPALLMAGLFLIIFAVVRGRPWLSLAGFASIVGAYAFNYYVYSYYDYSLSRTAARRLEIWLRPWDTTVTGGEQIVQSLWALAAGGVTGTGLGLGEPRLVPAAHTDLILSSLGEEFGFVGLLLIGVLYATLLHRCFRVALNAPSAYTYFLAAGVTVLNALQVLFIGAAVLGLIPLSGVTTPFLSYGSTSMVMSFVAFGVVLIISGQGGAAAPDVDVAFAHPTRYVARAFALLALVVLCGAAWVQVVKADEITLRSVLAPQGGEEVTVVGDTKQRLIGVRRYIDNPRIRQVLAELPYGTIYDRKHIPLASSDWRVLDANREKYRELGVDLDKVCRKGRRCYPFGPVTFFLLGDVRTRKNWAGRNDFIEKDYEARLRGFNDHKTNPKIPATRLSARLDPQTNEPVVNPETHLPEWEEESVLLRVVHRDYRELLPLLRDRYSPGNLEADKLRFKPRDVFTSIDVELQVQLTKIVEGALRERGLNGAAVVLNPRTGELLASVSYPYPSVPGDDSAGGDERRDHYSDAERLTDRARDDTAGVAPGSTFKIVTAMAATEKPDGLGQELSCVPVEGVRNGVTIRGNGTYVRGWPFRDHEGSRPHGPLHFDKAFSLSCNAYFVQLGEKIAKAEGVYDKAKLFGITVSHPSKRSGLLTEQDYIARLDKYLPQASIGQGEVRANALQMAEVAAAIANRGTLPALQWAFEEDGPRQSPTTDVVAPAAAEVIAKAMFDVTTDEEGTAFKAFADSPVKVAGKTGTAQNFIVVNGKNEERPDHSWFVGYAPYEGQNQIAFAVVAENGRAGAGIAASISKELVKAALKLHLI